MNGVKGFFTQTPEVVERIKFQRDGLKAAMCEAKRMLESGVSRANVINFLVPFCDDPEARGERPLLEDAS